jgi:predicted RNase H-like HicB family nuclease
MEPTFTAVYRRVSEGYAAFVEELPGANSQGATLEEARENLREAITLVREANRFLAEEQLGDAEVIREATVPRHREINDFTARKICKDLDIPESNG